MLWQWRWPSSVGRGTPPWTCLSKQWAASLQALQQAMWQQEDEVAQGGASGLCRPGGGGALSPQVSQYRGERIATSTHVSKHACMHARAHTHAHTQTHPSPSFHLLGTHSLTSSTTPHPASCLTAAALRPWARRVPCAEQQSRHTTAELARLQELVFTRRLEQVVGVRGLMSPARQDVTMVDAEEDNTEVWRNGRPGVRSEHLAATHGAAMQRIMLSVTGWPERRQSARLPPCDFPTLPHGNASPPGGLLGFLTLSHNEGIRAP